MELRENWFVEANVTRAIGSPVYISHEIYDRLSAFHFYFFFLSGQYIIRFDNQIGVHQIQRFFKLLTRHFKCLSVLRRDFSRRFLFLI